MQKFTAAQLLLTKQIMELAEVIANNIIDCTHPTHNNNITYTLGNPEFSDTTHAIIFGLTSEKYCGGHSETDYHQSIVITLEDLNDSEAAIQRAIDEHNREKQVAKEVEARWRETDRQSKIDREVLLTKTALEALHVDITPEMMTRIVEEAIKKVDK